MAVPPVARTSDTPGWRMNMAVVVRLARSTDCSRSGGAPCPVRTSRISATVAAPTRAAAGWWLTIRALRALRQIRVLKTRVATGLVMGMSPSTTPTGLAISVTPRSSGGRGPIPGRPWRARLTSRLAKRFLKVLSATLPIPVSATVATASSPARPATASATAVTRAPHRSAGRLPRAAGPDLGPRRQQGLDPVLGPGGQDLLGGRGPPDRPVDPGVDVGREHVLLQVPGGLAGLGGGVPAQGAQHRQPGRRVVGAQPGQAVLGQDQGRHLGVGVGAGRAG